MTNPIKVFVSVGRARDDNQTKFIEAIEDRLKAEGLYPCTVGRNFYRNEAPLIAVKDLMKECHGAVVIALERFHFPEGVELRGKNQKLMKNVKLPTVWNQTEAAMAYSYDLPTLLIAETGLEPQGFLEKGSQWIVHRMVVSPNNLALKELVSPAFNGALADWKEKVNKHKNTENIKLIEPGSNEPTPGNTNGATVGQLVVGVVCLMAILATTVGLLTYAANKAPSHFNSILIGVVPLMILGLAFVARASGLIGSGQMVSLFRLTRKQRTDHDEPSA